MEVVFLGIWVLGSILHTYPPIIFWEYKNSFEKKG